MFSLILTILTHHTNSYPLQFKIWHCNFEEFTNNLSTRNFSPDIQTFSNFEKEKAFSIPRVFYFPTFQKLGGFLNLEF
jgi:hypothetical protein